MLARCHAWLIATAAVDGSSRRPAPFGEAQQAGELDAHVDSATIAAELLTLMDGLSLQSVLLESSTHRRQQIEQLDRLLERLSSTS